MILNQVKEKWISLTELEQIDIDHFDQTIEVYKSDDVYLNLLRLGSGIDSFVVGKPEVFDEIVQSLKLMQNLQEPLVLFSTNYLKV